MKTTTTTTTSIFCKDLGTESNNLDCIDTNLWLGNFSAASDVELLTEIRVKCVLTVNSYPLPTKIVHLSCINSKYIGVFDTPEDDLLSHFEETYEFIECGVKKGAVLVHCYNGISRSPTVVMAYLMKKKELTMEAAFAYVKSRRKCIEPNSGFLAQLSLYESMHWSLDKSNVQYKMFRLYITAGHVVRDCVVPDFCIDVINVDPIIVTSNTNSAVYRCKKCRRVLAQGCNVIPHAPSGKYCWKECSENTSSCQLIYFIEPLAWMGDVAASREGKLRCPNKTCKNKLGSFSWITGCRCPCGTVACPGFYLIPSKVDKVDRQAIVKNTSKKSS